MNENIKSYLTEAYEGYSKSLTQVNEFLGQQEEQLEQAKEHRDNMITKIKDLAEMLGIDETVEVVEPEPEPAPV
tara:strand:- start:273 stop:494 length:222 start_codon:yes stop_codon:yes gene_type:complete